VSSASTHWTREVRGGICEEERRHVSHRVRSQRNRDDGIFQFAYVPETVFVSAQGILKQVYYGAIPRTCWCADCGPSNDLVESKRSRRDERCEQRQIPSTSQSVPVGMRPCPSTR